MEDAEKWRRRLYEPFPGQKLKPEEAARLREEELAQFAAAFGSAPPPPSRPSGGIPQPPDVT